MASAFLFSACSHEDEAPRAVGGPVQDLTGAPAADQKSGTTTKTGAIIKVGSEFFLTELGGTPKKIESYEVALDDFVDQNVTVTGKYSGDTLFVGSVE